MNKPLVYADSDFAISCLRSSFLKAGFSRQADMLLGLTVSSPDSARHAKRIVLTMPSTELTEPVRQGALEILAFASEDVPRTALVQAPID